MCACLCVLGRERERKRESLFCSCACISVTCVRVRKGEKWIEFLEGAFAFAFAFSLFCFVVVVWSSCSKKIEGASAYKGGKTYLLLFFRLLWQSMSTCQFNLSPLLLLLLLLLLFTLPNKTSFLHQYVFSCSLHAVTIIEFSLLHFVHAMQK